MLEQLMPTTRGEKILFGVVRLSGAVFLVILADAFMMGGEGFDNPMLLGTWTWSVVVFAITSLIYVLLRFPPTPTNDS